MRKSIVAAAIATLAFAGGVVALAQTHADGITHTDGVAQTETMNYTAGMGYDMSAGATGGLPIERVQGAFAAVSEIVTMLAAYPSSWRVVNNRALRDHHIDMASGGGSLGAGA